VKVAIPGAGGLIGRSLTRRLLDRGHQPVALTRRRGGGLDAQLDIEVRTWQPGAAADNDRAFDGVDAVVNLAGEPIGTGRWTGAKMARIRNSRVLGNKSIVAAMARQSQRPRVYIAGSAVGYYGSRGDEVLTEDAAAGEGFLAGVCRDLEGEAAAAADVGVRVVCLRTGVVLSGAGGALAKMLPPFKFGLGGRIGSGKQWFSWIHANDIAGIILHCLERDDIEGPVNGAAPNPVTNAAFTKSLAQALGRPALLPVPEFVLKLLFGRMAGTLTASHRVIPKKIEDAGFKFQFPDLEESLANCLEKGKGRSRDPRV
jgi:uncharacterized protein (TIGR01777 family)